MAMHLPKRLGATIDDLPEGILVDIFAIAHPKIEEGNQLLRYTEVCKHWRQLLQPLVKCLKVPSWFSPELALRHINKFPNLRSLTLQSKRCASSVLVAIFGSLGRECPQLRELNLIKVWNLNREPINLLFYNVTSLHALLIKSTNCFIDLSFLGQLTGLERLHIEDAILENRPRRFDRLTSLRTLILRNVKGIDCLYPLNSLTKLEEVDLQPSPASPRLREQFGGYHCPLDTLGALRLEGLTSLQALTLCLREENLHYFSSLRGLTNLRSLDLQSLLPEEFSDIATLSYLEHLKLVVDYNQLPIALSGLTTLRTLSLSAYNLRNMAELPVLDTLSLLTRLEISEFSWFNNGAEQLLKLSHLTDLRVRLSDDIFAFLGQELRSVAVTDLKLYCTGQVVDHSLLTSGIALLPNLTSLMLKGDSCTPLPPFCGPCPSLKSLRLKSFSSGNVYLIHESFPALTSLSMEWLNDIPMVESAAGATNLQKLKCLGCSTPSLPGLAVMHSLRSLEISSCSSITEVPSLWGLCALEDLKVADCKKLRSIPDLSRLSSLKRLLLVDLPRLRSLPSLDGLLRLDQLRIRGCLELRLLPELSSLHSLRLLKISACPLLQYVPPLTGLSRLLYVNLGSLGQAAKPNMEGTNPDLHMVCLKLRHTE